MITTRCLVYMTVMALFGGIMVAGQYYSLRDTALFEAQRICDYQIERMERSYGKDGR